MLSCQPGISRLSQAAMQFEKGRSMGRVDKKVKEVSGIACSVSNPGMIWAINDGGNEPNLYLLNKKGKVKMECTLPVVNRDWEAMGVVYDSTRHTPVIYIGDIGDNAANNKEKIIYWLDEPIFDSNQKSVSSIRKTVIELKQSMDMESMFVDPVNNELMLFSKREDSIGI